MKIGIIGSGNVGGTLGTRWSLHHEVTFGSREPGSAEIQQLLAKAGPGAKGAAMKEAAEQNDVLLLATPWPAAKEVIGSLGSLSGKLLIDATNPLLPDMSGLDRGTVTSAGEQVAEWARGAKVVKAFNTVGFNIMADCSFEAGRVSMFYCGDDAGAKETVRQLAEDLGFEALDAGPLTQARVLEPFALLWISMAVRYGYGRDFAFHLLRR